MRCNYFVVLHFRMNANLINQFHVLSVFAVKKHHLYRECVAIYIAFTGEKKDDVLSYYYLLERLDRAFTIPLHHKIKKIKVQNYHS